MVGIATEAGAIPTKSLERRRRRRRRRRRIQKELNLLKTKKLSAYLMRVLTCLR
jgi:hypothetical protein